MYYAQRYIKKTHSVVSKIRKRERGHKKTVSCFSRFRALHNKIFIAVLKLHFIVDITTVIIFVVFLIFSLHFPTIRLAQ